MDKAEVDKYVREIAQEEISPPPFKEAKQGHITVVETVYYQQAGEQPVPMDSRYVRLVDTDEQVYIRKYTIGEQWEPIDCGWVKDVGLVIIRNEKPPQFVQPTQEVRDELEKKIVEVEGSGGWTILPGESMRGSPVNARSLHLRCRYGNTKITVAVYPK